MLKPCFSAPAFPVGVFNFLTQASSKNHNFLNEK